MTHEPNIPPKPIPLTVLPDAIPPELKALDQWLIWKYFYKPDLGYWDKPPLDANKSGNTAKSTDPKTYATFDKALSSYRLGNYDGVGLALTLKNLIVGFDLDSCRDPQSGEIAPWALKIVHQIPTYWEISTSGTGLRGFGYSHKPGSRCRAGDFEMYTSGRYLCITGHHLEGTPYTVEPVQGAINAIYAQMFPTQEHHASSNGNSPHADDTAIIDALRHYKNGAKFRRLFDDGDISEYQGDHSVADQGLCRLIAFRTQDPNQVDRIFRLSALNRQKWESRADYRNRTIARAITHVRDRYQGVSAEHNGQPEDERHTSGHGDSQEEQKPPVGQPIMNDRGRLLLSA
jgi:putative DNA primase/helicase